MSDRYFLTTAIPYVNAKPHVGHALEFVQADAIARYQRLLGWEVRLLSGGDENALKNVAAAEKAGKPVREFIDENSQAFKDLAVRLDVRFDVFQKGSDTEHHFKSSQKLWELCAAGGDIYRKSYEGLYCTGCEAFYTKDELNENGECFEHPGRKLELVREENYFFRLSKYQERLIALISGDTLKITPDFRKNEVLSFLKQPLQDISISRSNERAKNWGVPVPGDDTQRIYVWFDALNIYQSGVGFGWDEQTYAKWWPADLHVIGKGITRFHAIYWPAFLMSAKLELPRQLFVHGYFTVEGQKMSKTLGNVVDPNDLIGRYGTDALRYYFLREIPSTADGDFSENRMKEIYNADLANGLGNLSARVARLASQTENVVVPAPPDFPGAVSAPGNKAYPAAMDGFRFQDAIAFVWEKIRASDKFIDVNEPWKQTGAAKTDTINALIPQIQEIATLMLPFMPTAAGKILLHYSQPAIGPMPPLFPRIK